MTDKPIIRQARCTECLNMAEPTDWTPPQGINSDLIQYRCPKCGEEFYKIVH